jgi:type IV secretion system protein VirD4
MDFSEGRGRGAGKHPLLLMLDEFPALGKLQFFQESLAYLAGYGIRAMLITQDLSQHQGVYGRQESITANCHVRIAFAANKPETAELLSQMAGDTTVSHKQVSYRGGGVMPDRSITQQEIRRRLLTPDEAMRLHSDHEVVFVAGQLPIYAEKLRYFEDPEMQSRARDPAPGASETTGAQGGSWPSSPNRPPELGNEPREGGGDLRDLAKRVDERHPELGGR